MQERDHMEVKGGIEKVDIAGFIGAVGGLAAIVVALFWYTGRAYLRAYLNHINIPINQVNLSTWEYGEEGLTYILQGFLICGIFIFLTYYQTDGVYFWDALIQLVIPVRFKIFLFIASVIGLFGVITLDALYWSLSFIILTLILLGFTLLIFILGKHLFFAPSSDSSRLWDILFIFLFLNYFLIFLPTSWARNDGKVDGRSYVVSDAPIVQLISDYRSFPFPMDEIIVSNGSSLYLYKNLRLLTYNDGKYFFYKHLDMECKPKEVYIIHENTVKSVEYAVPSTKVACGETDISGLPPAAVTPPSISTETSSTSTP